MISRLSNSEGCGKDPRQVADEMAELSLLVPGWQAQALEEAAHARGLTAAQVVRRLIRDFCSSDVLDLRDRFVLTWSK